MIWPDDLPPFSEYSKCPKCEGGEVLTSYQRTAHCSDSYCVLRCMVKPDCCKAEHMHRTCIRCHYGWAERVLGSRR